ncbi:23S rRNA (adenine(2030)-N(6))-methyltransferase RlmJ [Teredinibacter haidensis]|uniref:23S rRNA (adenine(2030)-N(6))-methyltransferase RlmJ n=1 Tax=Teredinibacter haidensis TaxID=2731755 RepID=UPI000948B428|nr:23S rRNA (adenine(2030)-N(6))-methyltransferase RlmJ [Teredinibacter haidensis]
MLSYRHAFHVGNYADVLKHFIVCRILTYLTQKSSAVRYIDTHAGAGVYPLAAAETEKLGEYRQGISLLRKLAPSAMPESVGQYMALVNQLNSANELSLYPGSPWFAHKILRSQDRLNIFELQSTEFSALQQLFSTDSRVSVLREDGFKGVRALLPPRTETRAFVLIDPSYEMKQEYRKIPELVTELHKKFSTGVFAVWYPVVGDYSRTLLKAFELSGIKKIARFELARSANVNAKGMRATGMLVVNPPWTLANDVAEFFSLFAPLVDEDTGKGLAINDWLVGER